MIESDECHVKLRRQADRGEKAGDEKLLKYKGLHFLKR